MNSKCLGLLSGSFGGERSELSWCEESGVEECDLLCLLHVLHGCVEQCPTVWANVSDYKRCMSLTRLADRYLSTKTLDFIITNGHFQRNMQSPHLAQLFTTCALVQSDNRYLFSRRICKTLMCYCLLMVQPCSN